MKVKEVGRTANMCWSPATYHPALLAAGTAAQQLDASFSTSAILELYSLNLTEPGHDMSLVASVPSDLRFHRLCWGPGSAGHEPGFLVGGCDQGQISVYRVSSMMDGSADPLVYTKDKHNGPVRALDFNPFQSNLLASGASDSEIYIWDLNNPTAPMTPGAKSQPTDDVACVAWNRQVQHILASAFPTRCVVWDLRKNEPIIKVSDSTSRMRCKVVCWHPETATQLCLASEEDHTPVIQVWDLRFATSPLKTLEGHQRGILSLAWCPQDPDLLLSCGKDSRILCWNPNTTAPGGEIVCELPTSNQWTFEVQWCPRNPALMATASFDGHVSVYSLMGGQQQVLPSSRIADSFPGLNMNDPFGGSLGMQQMANQQAHPQVAMQLKKPPRWLRKPCPATFGFGGKLVMLDSSAGSADQTSQTLKICRIVTEPDLIERSERLEKAIQTGQISTYCQEKYASAGANAPEDLLRWQFLKAQLVEDPCAELLPLLGFKPEELKAKVLAVGQKKMPINLSRSSPGAGLSVDDLANRMATLSRGDESLPSTPPAEELSCSATETPDGTLDHSASAFDAIASSSSASDGGADTPASESRERVHRGPLRIHTGSHDLDSAISESLILGQLELAVEMCLGEGRAADAMVLAVAGGPDLLAQTQHRYFQSCKGDLSRLICAVVTEDWGQVAQDVDLGGWKQALAAALTYAKGEEFRGICEILGHRLETETSDPELNKSALLCYICAGSLDKFADCWEKVNSKSSKTLQELVEQVMILKQASVGPAATPGGSLERVLTGYAGLLCGQGSLSTALAYIGDGNNNSGSQVVDLRDRLLHALGYLVEKPTSGQVNTGQVAQGQSQQRKVSYGQQSANYFAQPQFNPHLPVSTPAPMPSQPALQPKHVADPSVYQPQNQYYYPNQAYPAPTSTPQPFQFQPPKSYSMASPGGPVAPGPVAPSPVAPGMMAPGQSISPAPSSASAATPTIYNPQEPPAHNVPQPMMQQNMQSMMCDYSSAATGWNDPPAIRSANRGKPKVDYATPDPITHPIYGSVAPAEVPPPAHMQQQAPQMMHPQNHISQQQLQQQPPQVLQQAPPVQQQQQLPPKPKGPIPEQHRVLQEVFHQLWQKCTNSAQANPQMKRKLEDVARKLEALYDKLRVSELSDTTLSGLHQLVHGVQICDYNTALTSHTQMVSGGNFAEMSSFMPGLKVLLQTAAQLQVYVQ